MDICIQCKDANETEVICAIVYLALPLSSLEWFIIFCPFFACHFSLHFSLSCFCVLVPFLRYHYNVADARLDQHVDRGNADGLLISCVASCSNLWALIMDAGTGFTSQVYELSPFFLHKVNFIGRYCFILSWSWSIIHVCTHIQKS